MSQITHDQDKSPFGLSKEESEIFEKAQGI